MSYPDVVIPFAVPCLSSWVIKGKAELLPSLHPAGDGEQTDPWARELLLPLAGEIPLHATVWNRDGSFPCVFELNAKFFLVLCGCSNLPATCFCSS